MQIVQTHPDAPVTWERSARSQHPRALLRTRSRAQNLGRNPNLGSRRPVALRSLLQISGAAVRPSASSTRRARRSGASSAPRSERRSAQKSARRSNARVRASRYVRYAGKLSIARAPGTLMFTMIAFTITPGRTFSDGAARVCMKGTDYSPASFIGVIPKAHAGGGIGAYIGLPLGTIS